eukprot:UN09783
MPPEFQLRQAEREKMNNQKLAYDDDELLNKQEQAFEINPKDVDAYWLLRRMGDIIEDEQEKKEKADDVWKILSADTRQLER